MEDRFLELIDTSMGNTCNLSEVLCAINVGLLCVQHFADDRPSMHSVALFLGSEGALPQPKQPCFFTERNVVGANPPFPIPGEHMLFSDNEETTITLLEAR